MAKYCYLIFEEGYLICTVQHRDQRECDLYDADGYSTPTTMGKVVIVGCVLLLIWAFVS